VIEAEEGRDLTKEDPDNPTGTLVRQIFAVISQFEKTSIVSKLRKARERKKAETGRCEGAKPFGSLPGEKEVLERMFTLRNEGHTVRDIADTLNEDKYPTRNGRPWHFSSVAKILARYAPQLL
jgi:DNA invertase Pin-like site-specific DNA recombinase